MTDTQMQHLLTYLGYDTGGVDGIHGPKTTQAVKDFQEDYGLPVTGQKDSHTEMALKDSVTYDKFKPPDVSESDTGTFWAEIPNFSRDEFKCKCGGRYCNGFPAEPKEAMVRLAQAARTYFGRPAIIISGLRCSQHNANVDGVANSQHMAGEACDLAVPGVTADALLNFLQSQPGVRYAYKINSTNVHFDIPKGG